MRRLVVLLVALIAVSACGNDSEPAAAPPPAGPPSFKVMTQNLYLGGDLDVVISAGANLPQAVDQIWANVQATDFAARAKVIAETIATAAPDLVGLQEVTLWRTQTPGDRALVPNATTVAIDFLDVLSRALADRGLDYRVVATVTNGDVELPGASGTDYRLTDRDVILAKRTLPVLSTSSGHYPHFATLALPNPAGGAPIQAPIPRGWVSATFRSGAKTIAFFNTHLEAFSPEIATLQAQDLVGIAKPAAAPTVIVGDMNLPPGSPGYAVFVAPQTGLRDAWDDVNGGDPGLTCCWAPDLRGGAFDKRIDLVFSTAPLDPNAAAKVDETERTPGGLAPSDHAGVVVGFAPTVATSTVAAR